MHGIALSSMLLAFVYIDFNSSENMLMLPIFAVIIFLCAIDHGSAFKTFLETYPLRHLGKISYSLYMMHMSVQIGCLFIVSNIAPDLKYGLATQFGWSRLLIGDAITIAYVLLIVTAATLTYRHIEEPSRRLGSLVADRLTRRKRFAGVGDMILPVSAQKNLD